MPLILSMGIWKISTPMRSAPSKTGEAMKEACAVRRIVGGEIFEDDEVGRARLQSPAKSPPEVGVLVGPAQQRGAVVDLLEHAVDDVPTLGLHQEDVVVAELIEVTPDDRVVLAVEPAVGTAVAGVLQEMLRPRGVAVARDVQVLEDPRVLPGRPVALDPRRDLRILGQPGKKFRFVVAPQAAVHGRHARGHQRRIPVYVGEGLAELRHRLDDHAVLRERRDLAPDRAEVALDLTGLHLAHRGQLVEAVALQGVPRRDVAAVAVDRHGANPYQQQEEEDLGSQLHRVEHLGARLQVVEAEVHQTDEQAHAVCVLQLAEGGGWPMTEVVQVGQ